MIRIKDRLERLCCENYLRFNKFANCSELCSYCEEALDKLRLALEAFTTSQDEQILSLDCLLRGVKYLDNIIEQDHRFIKKKVRAAQCFKSFHTAVRTLEGIEAVNMLRKGQVKRLSCRDAQGQAQFVLNLFQIAA